MSPIERYLGIEATRGPVELLGLHTPDCTHEQVIQALRTRLGRVARHPLGRSVEADEVRLALHAAAAQLMDPRVRAHLLSEPREEPTEQDSAEHTPEHKSAADRTRTISDRELDAFRHTALAMLRRTGGWNRRSMQYVAGLAHASGIPVTELSRALHRAPVTANASARESGVVSPASRTRREASTRTDPVLAIVGVVGGVGITLIVVLAVVASLLPERTPSSQSAPTQTTSEGEAPPAPVPGVERQSQLIVDASNLLETLQEAHDLIPDNVGEGAWRFERAMEWLAPNWHTLDEPFRFVIEERITSILLDIPSTSASWERAFESVVSPSRRMLVADAGGFDPPGAIWSVWYTQELRRQLDTSSRLYDATASILGEVFGGRVPRSVDSSHSLLDASRVTLERILTRDEPEDRLASMLASWHECMPWIQDDSVRQRLLIGAIDRVLRMDESISQSRPLRDATLALMGDLAWSVQSDASPTHAMVSLLSWLDDPNIDTRNLSVVTQWLSLDPDGPSVPSTLILAPGASQSARASVRERLGAYWAIGDIDEASPRQRWRRLAADHLSTPIPVRQEMLLEDLARSGSLLEGGHMIWSRRYDEALRTLDAIESSTDHAPDQPDVASGETGWMVQYVTSTDSLEGRLDALRTLETRQGLLTQGEGDLLAEVATRGTPNQVRRRAQWIVRERRAETSVLRGLLESLGSNRWREDAHELLDDITGLHTFDHSDPRWRDETRRALTGLVLDAMSRRGPEGDGQQHVARLEMSLRSITGTSPHVDDVPSGITLNEATRQLRRQWEEHAMLFEPNPSSRVTLDEIRQRRLGRLRLIEGPIREFAVEQLSLVELLAYVMVGERPDATYQVESVMDDLLRDRSASGSVLEQIAMAQRAIVELWWIRLGFPARIDDEPSAMSGGDA